MEFVAQFVIKLKRDRNTKAECLEQAKMPKGGKIGFGV